MQIIDIHIYPDLEDGIAYYTGVYLPDEDSEPIEVLGNVVGIDRYCIEAAATCCISELWSHYYELKKVQNEFNK